MQATPCVSARGHTGEVNEVSETGQNALDSFRRRRAVRGRGPRAGMTTVRGTTLEETPPAQANGGGFNSSLSAGVITLAAPLAPGATIDVQWLLGIQQTGAFRFYVNIEALP